MSNEIIRYAKLLALQAQGLDNNNLHKEANENDMALAHLTKMAKRVNTHNFALIDRIRALEKALGIQPGAPVPTTPVATAPTADKPAPATQPTAQATPVAGQQPGQDDKQKQMELYRQARYAEKLQSHIEFVIDRYTNTPSNTRKNKGWVTTCNQYLALLEKWMGNKQGSMPQPNRSVRACITALGGGQLPRYTEAPPQPQYGGYGYPPQQYGYNPYGG